MIFNKNLLTKELLFAKLCKKLDSLQKMNPNKKKLENIKTVDSECFEYLDQIYAEFEKTLSFQSFLSFFQDCFGYDRVALFNCKSVEDSLFVSYVNGLDGFELIVLPKKNYNLPSDLISKLEKNSQPLEIDLNREDLRFFDIFQSISSQAKILFPLKFRGNLNGFVLVSDEKTEETEKAAKSKENKSILPHFLNLLSLAVENQILFEMVNLDRMTGLYNQHYFKTRLSDELERTNRYKRSLSLILVDLDFFKKVNDMYGHLEGDRIIKEFSRYLRSKVRKVDIVSRYGGEEFTVILPETTLKQATKVANKLCFDLSKEEERIYIGDEKKSFLTASFGVSSSENERNERTDDPDLLLHAADQAMYLSKDRGRNQVSLYLELIDS